MTTDAVRRLRDDLDRPHVVGYREADDVRNDLCAVLDELQHYRNHAQAEWDIEKANLEAHICGQKADLERLEQEKVAVLDRLEAAERVCRVLKYHLDESIIQVRDDYFEDAAFAELKAELDAWNASAGDKL